MSQSAKHKDSEIILTFTENENTGVSWDFRFQKLTGKGVILYFLVPRNFSDYVKPKALWDCKRQVKSRPDPFPSCLRLPRTSTRDRERLAAELHEASFFSPSLVIMISTLQMRPVVLLCCIFWKIFKVERTQSRYCFRTGTF